MDPEIQTEVESNPISAPGTLRGQEIARRDAQQGFMDNAADGLQNNSLGTVARLIEDELPAEMGLAEGESAAGVLNAPKRIMAGLRVLTGFRSGPDDYDKSEKYEELTKGIPYRFHDEIMSNDNYAAAVRAKARVEDQLARGQRMGMQEGAGATLAIMAGSLVDVDLPLTFMTGGGFGAARVARAGVKMNAAMGTGRLAASVSQSALIGASAGLQAGVATGAAEMYWKDTGDWTMLASAALGGALMGGTLNGLARADLGVQIKAAQDEFNARVARDDPTLYADLDVNKARRQPLVQFDAEDAVDTPNATASPDTPPPETVIGRRGPVLVTDMPDSSVGAKQVNVQGVLRVNRQNYSPAPRINEITTMAENWRHDSGWLDRKRDAETEWLYNFATGKGGGLQGLGGHFAKDYNGLLNSESPTANFLAGAVFESPHGFGRGFATAAIEREQFTTIISEPMSRVNRTMVEWAKKTDNTMLNSGVHVSEAGQRQFYREVMLEVNARSLGRTRNSDPLVARAADELQVGADAALNIAKRTGLQGFDTINSRPYAPYRWSGHKMNDLLRRGVINETDLTSALANSYRSAGIQSATDAENIAKALVSRMRMNDNDIPGNLMDLLNGDGREWLEDALNQSGVSDRNIEGIIKRITNTKDKKTGVSYGQHRVEIDLEGQIPTLDGSMVNVVDLMDQDLNGSWMRYARGVGGASALASVGVNNRAMRESIITAIREEQIALGEEITNPDLLRAMFTHFDAGPVHGFSKMEGTTKGLSHGVSLAKRLTSLSLLGKLGAAQLAETGASIAALGVRNWGERAIMQRLNSVGRAEQKAMLDDMAFLTGRIGEEHILMQPHLELDSITAREAGEMWGGVQKVLGKMQFAHGYVSGFNNIRAWQQTTVAMGISDKVMRNIQAGIDDSTRKRIMLDFGLDNTHIDYIERKIADGTIEFGTRGNASYVNKLNLSKWDNQDAATAFAAGVTRSVNQQVQKSMAGEADSWMNGDVAALLMQFKTFPMQAMSKQIARNVRFMDTETVATFGFGLATAFTALTVSDLLTNRDRDIGERAKAAVGYSNMTGFIPMGWDPTMTMLGLDGARMNQYGPHSDILGIPSMDVANKLQRVPGAIANYVTGDADKSDAAAIKAIPFMNTWGMSLIW